MKLHINRNPGTSANGLTTKKFDTFELGNDIDNATRVPSLKVNGTRVPDVMALPIDHKSGEIIIWSKTPVENPYFKKELKEMEFGANWADEKIIKYLQTTQYISEQMLAEVKFDLPKDTLTPKPFWILNGKKVDGTVKDGHVVRRNYLETVQKKFFDTTTLDDSELVDYLFIHAILKCAKERSGSHFALSLEDIKNKPASRYYIYEESKEVGQELKRSKHKSKAWAIVNKVAEDYTMEQMYRLAMGICLKYKDVTLPYKNSSMEALQSWFFSFVKEGKGEMERLGLLISVYERMNDPKQKKSYDHEIFIHECINNKVLVKSRVSPDYLYDIGESVWSELGDITVLYKLDDKKIIDTLAAQLKAKQN